MQAFTPVAEANIWLGSADEGKAPYNTLLQWQIFRVLCHYVL